MRVLFVTNYYPPSGYGWGYMQLCEEVADGLHDRGHEVAVLTSTSRDGPEIPRPYPVHRLLSIDPDWHSRKSAAWQFFVVRQRREAQAVRQLRRLAKSFRPDVIFVWHYIGLPRAILQAAERLPGAKVVYYLAGYHPELPDEYLAYWQAAPVRPIAKLLKKPLSYLALAQLRHEGKPIDLRYENVICVSRYVRDRLVLQGLIPPDAEVVHNGIDLQQFDIGSRPRRFDDSVSLLYAGRLEPDKGVHHILQAVKLVQGDYRRRIERIGIVGDGNESYRSHLADLAQDPDLAELVEFRPAVPRDSMPNLLNEFDVLVLPSSLEALSRMMQEAMAMGLLVLGTTTGGSSELLVHQQTGLGFEAEDAASLATQLQRALAQPELAASLARAGQERIRKEFDIRQTIARIENYLDDLSGA